MPHLDPDYKLTDLLSSAGATIGVIVAGIIFLQFLSTKYTELIGNLRELTGSYRGMDEEEGRRKPLQSQIRNYHRRLRLLNRASTVAAIAVLCLLSSVLSGGLSVAFPEARAIQVFGSLALLAGLLLIGAGVAMELAENVMSRREVGEEFADLDESVRHPKP